METSASFEARSAPLPYPTTVMELRMKEPHEKGIAIRLRAKLLEVKQQLRKRMHDPAAQNGRWLRSIVQGYFNYHAVPGNIDSLSAFRHRVIRLWRTTMIHRGGKRHLTWARMQKLADRWFPRPRVLHPYPRVRFDA